MVEENLTDDQLRAIYAWIDAIPLTRPKRNMARDFSDGVLLAEVYIYIILALSFLFLRLNYSLFLI